MELIATTRCVDAEGRVSGNFSTSFFPDNTVKFLVMVEVIKVEDGIEKKEIDERIRFDITKDIQNWPDSTWRENVKHGDGLVPERHQSLYISKPIGTHGNSFIVSLYASEIP